MSDHRLAKLLGIVGCAASLAAVRVLALLPAAIGYRVACWHGDWRFGFEAKKRSEIAGNLQLILGSELSPTAVQQVTRDSFRLLSCRTIDVHRLRREARPMRRQFEIRGREHLEVALAAGKGAILCTGHFRALDIGPSVLHASGFPVTTVGRRWYNYNADLTAIEWRLWDRYFRPVYRLRQRPNIEPWPGRPQVAALAAAAVRANEVVTIAIDAPPLESDKARAIEVPFLGLRARLLPGAAVLAQVTGAPLLVGLMRSSADYRHQVLEISAPISLEGGPAAAFERCVAEVSAAILRSPADWGTWWSTTDLVDLGLIPAQLNTSPAAPALPSPPGRLRHGGSTDRIPTRG
jgi:Kdo2-lipid IVA lauroyltransferase/acyltransferase